MTKILVFITVALAVSPARADGPAALEEVDISAFKPKAAAVALGVEAGSWDKLLAKLKAYGSFRPDDGDYPANFGLSDVRGPASAAHLADYVSLWGHGTPSEFRPFKVTMVSESWTIPEDGNWHIDQWILSYSMDSRLRQISHSVLVETLDRTVVDIRRDSLPEGDPRVAAKLAELLKRWDLFEPQTPPRRINKPAGGISIGDPFPKAFSSIASGWPQVIDKALARGKWHPNDGEIPSNYGLEAIRGSTSTPHLADYINVYGWGWQGNFHPEYATLVSENWAIPADGNWHIDQWIFWITPDGAIQRVSHQLLIETMDREVLDSRNDRVTTDDPRAGSKLAGLLELWRAF